MQRILGFALVVVALTLRAHAQDVGVPVAFSQPGVYGRIDVGRYPQPAVILPQPVIMVPPPAMVVPPPAIYVWVPREHRKHWDKDCRKYNACAVPVYFVRHDWYDEHVHYVHGPHGHGKGKHKH